MENTKTHIIPLDAMVIMVGPSGAGKTMFVEDIFDEHEVISSDDIREWLTGDFQRQDKNKLVFEEMDRRIHLKLQNSQRVVVDATNIKDADRKNLVAIGMQYHAPIYYIVVNRPMDEKISTGRWRNACSRKGVPLMEAMEVTFAANEHAILSGDGNRSVKVIDTRDPTNYVKAAKALMRDPIALTQINLSYKKLRVIADVHGNIDELNAILDKTDDSTYLLFLGDIVDYGDHSWQCVDIVHNLVSHGRASMVCGNHDRKMERYALKRLVGEKFGGNISHGMDTSIAQLDAMKKSTSERYMRKLISLMDMSPNWIELGSYMFAHAAIDSKMWGNYTSRANKHSQLDSMSLYGETDGTTTETGYPTRLYNWVDAIPTGKSAVLGHQILSTEAPVVKKSPSFKDITFLDTGSSKGGFLSYMDFEINTSIQDSLTVQLKPIGFGSAKS